MRLNLRALVLLPALFTAGGCCRDEIVPEWLPIEPIPLEQGSTTFELLDWVSDPTEELTFGAATDGNVLASVDGSTLELAPQPDFEGVSSLDLTAWDACGNVGTTTVELWVGVDGGEGEGEGEGEPIAEDCAVTLTYTAQGSPAAVAIAGTMNDWDTSADRLSDQGDGTWSITLDLAPGAWPYKFVEIDSGGGSAWTCDPEAELIQCDEGYKSPDETSWSQDCTLGASACNSLLVVEDCGRPSLTLGSLDIDRDRATLDATVTASPAKSGAALSSATVTLDGEAIDASFDGRGLQLALSGLEPTRHTLRVTVTDADGVSSEELYIPFWMDDFDWDRGVLYYAFIDRLANGDPSLDASEGTSSSMGDYMGGDWQGLIDLLPYLDDLGVNVLWLTNPQDNADESWDGQCEETYAGYHGYWPVSGGGLDEHFGDEATLQTLIEEAHARNMRVLIDWVANHVHEEHPYYQSHPEWFGSYAWCEDADNWNDIPETCWFAPYLPDVDYYQADPLVRMVDDAVDLATTWELDGLRVDAAKHMPHSVQWNLEHQIQRRVEHTSAGGDEEFWTVGETFDGYDRINAYIGDDQLDGQFDFPLYYTVRSAFLDESVTLPELYETAAYSGTVYGGARMGTFLGNHDVSRFVTAGTESNTDACDSDEVGLRQAEPPDGPWIYESLSLAWTFLLTWPGIPLVYYGDELGLPGYGDPDNRQPLWWYTGEVSGGAVQSVDDMAERVGSDQQDVLYTVQSLAIARAQHPALSEGEAINWWSESELYAFARSADEDAVLVILNRSDEDRTLTNGLAFAGLAEGTWKDVLTSERFSSSGDSLTVDVPARGARVLVGASD